MVVDLLARRRDRMVQRAAEAELKPTIFQDPLLAQNRALSAFAVLLLLLPLAVVVVQTTDDDPRHAPRRRRVAAGSGYAVPTALFPAAANSTPIPDPLRVA